jgi:putative two-component system response regulator
MTATAEQKKQTILIVDDAPDNLALMGSLLKEFYKTKVALNGDKALYIAMSPEPPDLILLDVMMPGIDGYEVCRRLKENKATKDIPVIFLTAKTEVEDEQKGLELGAADYIAKPISPPIVLARVRNHLMLQSARAYLEEKNQFLENAFSRYVSSKVIDQLKETPMSF